MIASSLKNVSCLDKKSIFITGGTGFIGKWLVKSLLYLDSLYKLGLCITLLTRDMKATLARDECFSDERVRLTQAEITKLDMDEKFDIIIHAASTSSVDKFNGASDLYRLNILNEGTKRVCELAVRAKIKYMLLISSGGVYGKPNPTDLLNEDAKIAPHILDSHACYDEGKRVSELMCALYAKEYGFSLGIARVFATYGAYMDFDIHFAMGNFIADALNKKEIVIYSSGSQVRSYLYAADLSLWCLSILTSLKDQTQIYNVGSSKEISLKDLAYKINSILDGSGVRVLGRDNFDTALRYIPCTTKITSELGLKEHTSLDEGIIKTAEFLRQTKRLRS